MSLATERFSWLTVTSKINYSNLLELCAGKKPLIKTRLELEPNMGQVAEQHCREGRLLVFYMLICYKCYRASRVLS